MYPCIIPPTHPYELSHTPTPLHTTTHNYRYTFIDTYTNVFTLILKPAHINTHTVPDNSHIFKEGPTHHHTHMAIPILTLALITHIHAQPRPQLPIAHTPVLSWCDRRLYHEVKTQRKIHPIGSCTPQHTTHTSAFTQTRTCVHTAACTCTHPPTDMCYIGAYTEWR